MSKRYFVRILKKNNGTELAMVWYIFYKTVANELLNQFFRDKVENSTKTPELPNPSTGFGVTSQTVVNIDGRIEINVPANVTSTVGFFQGKESWNSFSSVQFLRFLKTGFYTVSK